MMYAAGGGWQFAQDGVVRAAVIVSAVTVVGAGIYKVAKMGRRIADVVETWLAETMTERIATKVGESFADYTKKSDERWKLNTIQHGEVKSRLDKLEHEVSQVAEETFRTGARVDAHMEMHREGA